MPDDITNTEEPTTEETNETTPTQTASNTDTHAVYCWKEITDLIATTLSGWDVSRVYSMDNLTIEKIKQAEKPICLVQLGSYAELGRTLNGHDVEVNMQYDIQLAGNLGTDLVASMDEYLKTLETLKTTFLYCEITLDNGEKLKVKDVQCSNDQLYDERAFMTDRIYLCVCCLTVRAYRTM